MEFKSVADSILGQNGNVAAREEKPREKAVIFPTPPASQRANSCFMLRKSRPNDRFFLFYFFMSNPPSAARDFFHLFRSLSTLRGITKSIPSLKILPGYPGRSWMVFWCVVRVASGLFLQAEHLCGVFKAPR